MVITGLTRNQVARKCSWVRIPPLPPEKSENPCVNWVFGLLSFVCEIPLLPRHLCSCKCVLKSSKRFLPFSAIFFCRFLSRIRCILQGILRFCWTRPVFLMRDNLLYLCFRSLNLFFNPIIVRTPLFCSIYSTEYRLRYKKLHFLPNSGNTDL